MKTTKVEDGKKDKCVVMGEKQFRCAGDLGIILLFFLGSLSMCCISFLFIYLFYFIK